MTLHVFSQQKGGLEITNQWWGCFYTPFGERCDERWGNGSPSRTGLSMESVPWHEDVRDFAQQLSQSLPGYEIACEHEHSCSVLLAHRDRFFTPFGHWSLAWTDSSAFVLASKGNCSSNYFSGSAIGFRFIIMSQYVIRFILSHLIPAKPWMGSCSRRDGWPVRFGTFLRFVYIYIYVYIIFIWGGVGCGGTLTSSRPPPWYILRCERMFHQLERPWWCKMMLRWQYVGVGWGGVRYKRPHDHVLDTIRCQRMFHQLGRPWWCNMMLRWQMGMTLVQVNHQAKQFEVNLKKAPKRGLSKVGATQCLTELGEFWKKWLPKQLNIKKRSKGHGVVNPHRTEKTFQWLWRRNLNVNEKFTPTRMCQELGKLCKWRAWVWKMTLTPPPTGHRPRRDLGSWTTAYRRPWVLGGLITFLAARLTRYSLGLAATLSTLLLHRTLTHAIDFFL